MPKELPRRLLQRASLTEEGREEIKYTKVLDMRNKKGSNWSIPANRPNNRLGDFGDFEIGNRDDLWVRGPM